MEVRTLSQKKAVFRIIHKDYKMKLKDGTMMVMWFDNGTTLGNINDMPEDSFQRWLKLAQPSFIIPTEKMQQRF